MLTKITLSGFAGTGKSTVGKLIQEKLNYQFLSIGNYTRSYAKEKYQMSINEFQKLCHSKPEIDYKIDRDFLKLCNQDYLVIDYRLGFHFVKDSFNVILQVSDDIAYDRITKMNRKDENLSLKAIKDRNYIMNERFKEKYKIDFSDRNNYHLSVDTDKLSAIEVAEVIINAYREFNKSTSIPSINFHLWEPCNMRCKFCFATFQDVKQTILPKGHLPKEKAIRVVEEIAKVGFEKITFAGGEPLLCPWLPDLIKRAKQLGLTTMIVTNGSRLTEQFLIQNKKNLDWIALSIDSLKDSTNIAIGRAITGKNPLNISFYKELITNIHKYGYGLKVNTVVNALNYTENFNDFLDFAKPKRWKVLQVLPIKGQNDIKIEDFKINSNQFEKFVLNHQNINIMIPESNESIKGSYVMVDPAGRFFENSEGKHKYSGEILEVGVENALKMVNYNLEKFLSRGGIYNWKNVARKEEVNYED
ncbi:viperin family antiviral radical SAM protein [Mesoflavibacter profundi]|uniref:viperin family antiviral radical SAM protein n=1 Tax=Mesoflavibacter profundi TaxID=2708110 RepID=UPI0035165888